MPFMYPHVAYGTPSSLYLNRHIRTPVQIFHQLILYNFTTAVKSKSQKKQETAASPSWTGHRAPALTGTVTTGLLAISQTIVSTFSVSLSNFTVETTI